MKREAGAECDMPDNSRRPDQTPVAKVPNGHTANNHQRPPSIHTSEYTYPSEHKAYSAQRQDRRLYPSNSLHSHNQHHHQHASTRFETTLMKENGEDPDGADSCQRNSATRKRTNNSYCCSPSCLIGAEKSFFETCTK